MRIVVTNPGTEDAKWFLESEVLITDVPNEVRDEDMDVQARSYHLNTREAAQKRGLVTFDTAIPLAWSDDVQKRTGKWPIGFVWCYDHGENSHDIYGHPVPLTREARNLLLEYTRVSERVEHTR